MFTFLNRLLFNYKTRHLYCLIDSEEYLAESYLLGNQHFNKELNRNELVKGGHMISCINKNNNKVVGMLQFFTVEELKNENSFKNEYQSLDYIPAELHPYTLIADTITVDKKNKDKFISIILFKAYLTYFFQHKYNITVGICEPVLYHFYKQLYSFKTPIKLIRHPQSGFYIVMVSTRKDYEKTHYTRFLIDMIRHESGNKFYEVPEDVIISSEKIRSLDQPGINLLPSNEIDKISIQLLDGLSKQSRYEFFKNSVVVTCQNKDSIIKEYDGSEAIIIVKKGQCVVMAKDRVLATLGEGKLIGIFSFILNQPRSTNVYSASEHVELIILAKNCINYISDPEQKVQIWKNIAKELTQIIISKNSQQSD